MRKILILATIYLVGGMGSHNGFAKAERTGVSDPMKYAHTRADAYSGTTESESSMECETQLFGEFVKVSCRSETYSVVDWGPNGPESFNRIDACDFEFKKSEINYVVTKEICDTQDDE